jgi:hypothetical protein
MKKVILKIVEITFSKRLIAATASSRIVVVVSG